MECFRMLAFGFSIFFKKCNHTVTYMKTRIKESRKAKLYIEYGQMTIEQICIWGIQNMLRWKKYFQMIL